MVKIVVSRMAQPKHSGDWHDAPLRWQAAGPGVELQCFSTKRKALLYAKLRRRAGNATDAGNAYVRTA